MAPVGPLAPEGHMGDASWPRVVRKISRTPCAHVSTVNARFWMAYTLPQAMWHLMETREDLKNL